MGAAPVGFPVFALAALVGLGASWVLVSRIERLGTHFGISEALLGVIAALAADSPEITSAITAFGHRQSTVGTGVVLGSNVFNLAALLGLSTLIARHIRLHRRVVLLSGTVATWVAGISVLTAVGPLSAAAGLALVCVVVVPYVTILGMRQSRLRRVRLPRSWVAWLVRAIAEEESELANAQPHRPFRRRDLWVTGVSLLVVVAASVTMERAVTALGHHYAVPDLVIGALVLAGVTSLPNAVAASYLALRGRGAAVLSTALNSNALNVAVGWLLPATIAGVAVRSGGGALASLFYLVLTVASLAMAYYCRGLDRRAALVIVGTYFVFLGTVLASVGVSAKWIAVALVCTMVATIGFGVRTRPDQTADPNRRRSGSQFPGLCVSPNGHAKGNTLVPGWSVSQISVLGFLLTAAVAAVDSALGSRVLLLGLVVVGPCCTLLARRWRLTALAGVWAIGLAVVLGLPDGIWATYSHAAFLASISVVSLVATAATFLMSEHRRHPTRNRRSRSSRLSTPPDDQS